MKKILVANRGEIACRVMRSAKKLGIATVAVYSEVDVNAPHVVLADEAYLVGPSPSDQSYLVIDKIIKVAVDCGADAIHPGYGFLSENAVFANAVKEAGLTFIGPSAESITVMGSKLAAKEAVSKFDIPMVPGTDKALKDKEEALTIAKSIGTPVLIKASAGGGGKGMRIVHELSEVGEAFDRAVSEATNAFGDGSVFIEKYITSPRHIEIQILADNHDNYIHLFERECSIQRRHQKVVEEAPSVVLDDDLRHRMGQAAIDVARSCNYSGAGTVEFLLDSEKNFYFLEMNTRLQVEHPITELISGVDLVEQQIKVARGEHLTIKQDMLSITGHAIELRVYAEDPETNFMPSIGTLDTYQLPSGQGIRVDNGYREGMEVPIYYDPMLSKLVTYGADRDEAIAKMIYAIDNYHIEGVKNTLSFGEFVMRHPAFLSGDIDTHFVAKYFTNKDDTSANPEDELAAKIALKLFLEYKSNHLAIPRL